MPDQWLESLLDLLTVKTELKTDIVMLVIMKIKLNDSFVRLDYMFCISGTHASNIFAKSIIPIAHFLSTLIFWSPTNKIKYFLPIPFRARYNNVELIIDCLEIQIIDN